MQTNTGNYVIIAGLLVGILQHYNILADQDQLVTILSSGAIVYGWIHQWVITRRLKNMAIQAGVKGLK